MRWVSLSEAYVCEGRACVFLIDGRSGYDNGLNTVGTGTVLER